MCLNRLNAEFFGVGSVQVSGGFRTVLRRRSRKVHATFLQDPRRVRARFARRSRKVLAAIVQVLRGASTCLPTFPPDSYSARAGTVSWRDRFRDALRLTRRLRHVRCRRRYNGCGNYMSATPAWAMRFGMAKRHAAQPVERMRFGIDGKKVRYERSRIHGRRADGFAAASR